MSKVEAFAALQYKVSATPRPHVGVCVEIMIATPSGERALPAFHLPPDQAKRLAAALSEQAAIARSQN